MNNADLMFTCNEKAIEHYCDVFGIPEFRTTTEYEHFIKTEIPAIELESGKEYYVIPRLRMLRAPKSSFRRWYGANNTY